MRFDSCLGWPCFTDKLTSLTKKQRNEALSFRNGQRLSVSRFGGTIQDLVRTTVGRRESRSKTRITKKSLSLGNN